MRLKIRFFEASNTVTTKFIEVSNTFSAAFKDVQTVTQYVGGELYNGDYSVTPKVSEQKMNTAGKVMLEDVTVFAIPYFDVSNTSGGSTVYIADEIEF